MIAILSLLDPAAAQTLTCEVDDELCIAADEAAAAVNSALGSNFLHDGSGARGRASMPNVLAALRNATQDAVDAGCTVQHWVGGTYGPSRFDLVWDGVGNGAPLSGTGIKRADNAWLGLAAGSGPVGENGGWYSRRGQLVGFSGVDPTPDANDFLIGRYIRVTGSRGVVIAANLTCDPGADTKALADGWFQRDLSALTPNEVPVGVTLLDFGSTTPIVGAVVETPDGDVVTGADGSAGYTAPAYTQAQVPITAVGYPAAQLQAQAGGGVALTRVIPSNATLAVLSGALGIPIDPTKAIINYTASDFDGYSSGVSLEGIHVDLDVAYGIALVANDASPLGFSPGNTTLVGSPSSVIFVNVDTGPVTPIITPPVGYWCWEGEDVMDVPAGTYVMGGGYCVEEI